MEHYLTLAGIAIQTIIFLAGGYSMMIRNDSGTKHLKEEVVAMQEELKKLAKVVVEQAVQSTRIDNMNNQIAMLQRTIEDLRRGQGWIGGGRTGLDGEYK